MSAGTTPGASGSEGQGGGRPPDQVGARKESILTVGINDKETQADNLGFAPYVDAVAAFLINPATKPPFTISIEGKWGSGKSSFMSQLRKRIMDAEKLLPKDRQSFIFWFNPWRHDKQEALWAAFALEFLAGARRRLKIWQRWPRDWRLFRTRFAWTSGWTDLARKVLQVFWWALVILMLVILSWNAPTYLKAARESPPSEPPTKNGGQPSRTEVLTGLPDWVIRIGGVSGTAVLAVYLLGLAKKELANPIKVDLQRHIRYPRYESSVSFVEGFHRDFHKILKAYTLDRRVYVFIDDLDRCEVPRASELMQAINLLISEESQVLFVIGMDWDTVAAGIALKLESLSSYLTPDIPSYSPEAAGTGPTIDKTCHTGTRYAMQLGREFLEKFVQLRFKVPRPSNEDLRRLLLALSRAPDVSADDRVSQGRFARWRVRIHWWRHAAAPVSSEAPVGSRDSVRQVDEAAAQARELQELIEFGTKADSDTVQAVALKLMPAFDNNPRRLKQFLGLYRLRIYIAKVTGMFAIAKGKSPSDALTLEQLGKLTALELGWPDLLKAAEGDPELLGRVERAALGLEAGEGYWLQRRGLPTILKAGLDEGPALPRQWRLAGRDVSSLVRVSASVGAFDAKIGASPAAPEGTTRPQEELTAQELFERGFAATDKREKLRFYSDAIKLKPDYVPALINRGNVLSELDDVDGALKDYNDALRFKPHDAIALYNRAIAYSDKGDLDQALMDYDEAIRYNPDDADTFINCGIARASNGDMVGALKDFDVAIFLKSDDPDARYNRGIALSREGNLQGALTEYNRAIRLNPHDADAFFNRAIVRRATGDREGAAKDEAEAERLGSRPHS